MSKKDIQLLLNDYATYYNCDFMLDNNADFTVYTSDLDFDGTSISFNNEDETYNLKSNTNISSYDLKIISIACKNLLSKMKKALNTNYLLNKIIDHSINDEELKHLNNYLSTQNNSLFFILIDYNDDQNILIETLKNTFEDKLLIIPYNNDIILTVSTNKNIEEICIQLYNTISSELMVKTKLFYEQLANLMDIPKTLDKMLISKNIAEIYCPNKAIVTSKTLGIGNIINILSKDEALNLRNNFIANDLEELDNPEDIKTIYSFLSNNLNIAETARQLYVHRNTLIYRLDKYQKITNLDIRNFNEAVKFQIAFLIYQYYKK